jgi:peptidyl-prolyl cis-trans isomerase D
MIAKLKAGGTLVELAKADKMTLDKANNLQRGKPAGFLPKQVVEAAFATPKGVAAASDGAKRTERYVFRVTDVRDPKFDPSSPDGTNIAKALQNAYTDDITGEYIAQLENKLGVDINKSVVNQVIGGGTP